MFFEDVAFVYTHVDVGTGDNKKSCITFMKKPRRFFHTLAIGSAENNKAVYRTRLIPNHEKITDNLKKCKAEKSQQ